MDKTQNPQPLKHQLLLLLMTYFITAFFILEITRQHTINLNCLKNQHNCLFVAFPLVVANTGPGGFLVCVCYL